MNGRALLFWATGPGKRDLKPKTNFPKPLEGMMKQTRERISKTQTAQTAQAAARSKAKRTTMASADLVPMISRTRKALDLTAASLATIEGVLR